MPFQLHRSDSPDFQQLLVIRGPPVDEVPQGPVIEDDECRDSLGAGLFASPSPQRLE